MLTEMPNQEWDIFFPLPERGNVNREYVQSIEQIGAKLCSSTMAIKSLFGRGNQASICAKCAGTAQPFKLPLPAGRAEVLAADQWEFHWFRQEIWFLAMPAQNALCAARSLR